MSVKAQLFLTCLGENFFSPVLKDMVKLLERLGVQCEMPESQTCCGQPFYNSGFVSQAMTPARQWLKAFGNTDGYIVAPSGSCVDFVRHHMPELFSENSREQTLAKETAARTYELCEFITQVLKLTDVGARFPHKVTYHASCHGLRGLGLREEPKQLLKAVQGLELIPLNEEETCCGFGGVFSVVYPEVSKAMMDAKVKNILDSGAEYIVAGDPGCLMNIGGGLEKTKSPIKSLHIIQVLAAQ